MSMKKLYDAVNAAEARVGELAQRIDALIDEGKNAEALALRGELEQAQSQAREANQLYIAMRGASGVEEMGGRLVMHAKPEDMTIGMSQQDISNYSLIRAIRAAVESTTNPRAWEQAGLELEASQAMAQKLGRTPKGFFMPWDVAIAPVQMRGNGMRLVNTQSVGDPQAGGYLVEKQLLSGSFIDVLRNKMMCRAAGAQVLTGLVGDIDIPKKTATSTAYWVGEGSSPTKSTLAFGQIEGRPRTVAAYIELTRRFLRQSSMDVEMMTRDDLASTLAVGIDYAGLHGLGAANQPRGIANTPGIGSVVGGADGAAPTWANVIGLETEVAVDNADMGALAYMTNSKVRGKLKQTVRVANTDSRSIWEENEVNGYPAWVTNQVRSDIAKGNGTSLSALFFGNWSDLVFLFWAGLDVIVDPYTNSTSGSVIVTAMQDTDVVIRRPESFAAMIDAVTS